MSWKDATVGQLLDTPVLQPPFVGLKVTLCVVTLVAMVSFVVLLERIRHHD